MRARGWALAIVVLAQAAGGPALAFDPARMKLEAAFLEPARTFTYNQATHVILRDVDGDGNAEIVLVQDQGWTLLRLDAARGGLRIDGALQVDSGSAMETFEVRSSTVADVDGDGSGDLVACNASNRWPQAWSLPGLQPLAFAPAWRCVVTDEHADALAAPGEEHLFSDPASPGVALKRADGTEAWFDSWADSAVFAQLDADPELEVAAVASDIPPGLRVLDAVSGAEESRFDAAPLASRVLAVDPDRDGLSSLVTAGPDGVRLLATDLVGAAWSAPWDGSGGLLAVDSDGVPPDEVLAWSAGHPVSWWLLDSRTGTTILAGRLDADEWAVDDVDGDCLLEAVTWRDGTLAIVNMEDGSVAAALEAMDGTPPGPLVADLDGDGHRDLAWLMLPDAEVEHGTHPRVATVDLGRLAFAPGGPPSALALRGGLSAAQLDGDAPLEVVSVVEGASDLGVFDGVTWQLESSFVPAPGEDVVASAAADVDGDAVPELVVATHDPAAGPASAVIRAFRADHAPLWATPVPLLATWLGIRDVDGDGAIEVVAAGRGFRVLAGASGADRGGLAETLFAPAVGDVDGDGDADVLLAGSTAAGTLGRLAAWDALTQAPIFDRTLARPAGLPAWSSGAIAAVATGDLDGDGAAEIAVVQGATEWDDVAFLRVLGASDGAVLWDGERVPGGSGQDDGVRIVDVDGDGRDELVVTTYHGPMAWKHLGSAPDVVPPRWTGSVGVRAALPAPSASCCPAVDVSWEPATDPESSPVSYRVHRGAPGFTPGPATLVATAAGDSWRDARPPAGTDLAYVVRAVDAAGNEDANLVERRTRVDLGPSVPPAVVTGVTDDDPCALTGVTASFFHADPAGRAFDAWLDGALLLADVTSPVHVDLPDSRPHSLSVRVRADECGRTVTGVETTVRDGTDDAVAPVPTIRDLDACAPTGIVVTFADPPVPARHDLVVDGAVATTGIVSGHVHVPGDTLPHEYAVQAVALGGCPTPHVSAVTRLADAELPFAVATGVILRDLDHCVVGRVQVQFAEPPAADRYDLLRDGTTFAANVRDGSIVTSTDAAAHDWVVRAWDDSCRRFADSAVVRFGERDDCVPAWVDLRVRADGAGVQRLEWESLAGEAATWNAYVGTLGVLRITRAYDHVPVRPGLVYPDAPDSATGCSVANATARSARVQGLPAAAYVLVAAVSPLGEEGERGADSQGRSLSDPAVDPRPSFTFCP